MKKRALVVTHGYPAVTKGGAELAAHAVVRGLNEHPDWEAWLLARNPVMAARHIGTAFGRGASEREILFAADADHFLFANQNLVYLTRDFADLLRQLKPDVVHFHHYLNVGVEMIRVVRNVLPQARIVLTFHEFLAICNNNGQMLKTTGQLCYKASPVECHACRPERSPQDYFMRELYLKSFFGLVDRFIAPSAFLKQRYVDWGLPDDRFTVLNDGVPERAAMPPRALQPGEKRNRFAFFGQITPYKGIDVLLQAFESLPRLVQKQARLDVHGTAPTHHGDDFRKRIEQMFERAPPTVRFVGPYALEDLPRLMRDVDWVIVPSIWWENFPAVIQEAFQHRRPVICSDIGGMAEQVRDGDNGLWFSAGSAASLAGVVERAMTEPELWERLSKGTRPPRPLARFIDELVPLYA